MIISGGFNIYPSDLEAVLREHPGGGRRRGGRRAVGAVGRDAGGLRGARRPARHRAPRRCCSGPTRSWARRSGWRACSFIDELPRSAIGKVLKRELRERLTPGADARPGSTPAEHGGGNGLLWVLVVVAVGFAVVRPRAPIDYLRLVDWQTVGALAGLLAITQGVERSGMLQAAAARLLSHTHRPAQPGAACWRRAPPLLSALVTNDVSLFLLVPLTRVLATQAHLPLARLVVIAGAGRQRRLGADADRQSAEPLPVAPLGRELLRLHGDDGADRRR